MLAREKLGSTALGDGIAIPHCRLRTASEACGVLMTLATPTDFDAPDDEPVDLCSRWWCRSEPRRSTSTCWLTSPAVLPGRVPRCPARLPHLRGALQHHHQLGPKVA
jgi:hypothetical protein